MSLQILNTVRNTDNSRQIVIHHTKSYCFTSLYTSTAPDCTEAKYLNLIVRHLFDQGFAALDTHLTRDLYTASTELAVVFWTFRLVSHSRTVPAVTRARDRHRNPSKAAKMDIYADLPSSKSKGDGTSGSTGSPGVTAGPSSGSSTATPTTKGSWAHSKFQGMIAKRRTATAVSVLGTCHDVVSVS